jgi:hypothetical protein
VSLLESPTLENLVADSSTEARQYDGPVANVYKLQDAEPTWKTAGVKRTKVWYGPFTIAALDVSYPNQVRACRIDL